jgi:DNA-binding transcriptional LysR family regulator
MDSNSPRKGRRNRRSAVARSLVVEYVRASSRKQRYDDECLKMSPITALRDLNKIYAFVRIAERKSFTKAARDLRTTPSVLSKHLSELEQALGFSLLRRSTRGAVLTEAGEGLLKHCLQLLADLDDFVIETRNVQTGPYGSLRIQATDGYARWVLAPLVADFVRRHPHLRIQLSTETVTLDSVEDGYDIIIASRKPAIPGLIERDIGPVDHVICASPRYFERIERPSLPRELRDHNCLVNSFFAPREWKFQIGSQLVSIEVKGTVSSNSSAVLTELALSGVGVVRVPRYAVEAELESGSLEQIFQGIAVSHERLCAYFSKTKHLPAKVADFIQFLQGAVSTT